MAKRSSKKKTVRKAPARKPAGKTASTARGSSSASKKSPRAAAKKKSVAKKTPTKASIGVLEIGDRAPAFALPDQSGRVHSLEDYARAPLVLYFYPKDDTEDCTAQACGFTARMPDFSRVGAAVLGVSRLDVKSKAKFAAKHGITIPLLADEAGEVASKYGAWVEKSMYGKKFMAVARTTYLIDAQGNVARRWDKVDVEGHVDEVVGALRQLRG